MSRRQSDDGATMVVTDEDDEVLFSGTADDLNRVGERTAPRLRIRKVKYDLDKGEVHVRGEEGDAEHGDYLRTIEVTSRQVPRPELLTALRSLVRPALDLIGAADGWYDHAEARGVSIGWGDDGFGAVVTLLVPIEAADAPLVVNTPRLPESALPIALGRAVLEVAEEGARYLNGERAQANLFDG